MYNANSYSTHLRRRPSQNQCIPILVKPINTPYRWNLKSRMSWKKLTSLDILTLTPLDLHCGDYIRMQHGYQENSGILHEIWSRESVTEKIQHRDDQNAKDRCTRAYNYLMNSEVIVPCLSFKAPEIHHRRQADTHVRHPQNSRNRMLSLATFVSFHYLVRNMLNWTRVAKCPSCTKYYLVCLSMEWTTNYFSSIMTTGCSRP